ncbi:caspase family protein [Bradyrhizobium sp. I1.7.5]|uniref:caspase family protein n=1 Tax=Bradyrhizobium sp. I1.7.5 TaxID=3156363 RepID=UPI003394B014
MILRLMIGTIVALAAILTTKPAVAERRVALVIGNSAYQHVSRLDNPNNDARLVAETLRSVGFSLVGGGALLDLDKSSFDSAIQNFGDQIVGADVALFYFAGHGVQVRGSNHLVPINANPTKEADVDFQMVDVALVLRQMDGAGTKLNLVVLDACRNNPFGGRGLRSNTAGLAQMTAPEGTLISYATQPGNVAQDGSNGNSPYSKALAQTLRQPGLGIFEVFNEVGLTVKRSTGGTQQPWVSSSPIDGRFYFVPPLAGSAAARPEVPPTGMNEAAQAWSATKDTMSSAVLEAFIQRYGDSFYASLARARLDEIRSSEKKTAVAAVKPSAERESPLGLETVRQRAVLYDEDLTDKKGKQYIGWVVWRTEPIKPSKGQKADIAVRADIEIPERKFKMTMSFRRNVDPTLPASHTVELTFILPPDFVGGGVGNVPGILMKSTEQARGTPLAGLAVKVTDGFFLVGLSNVDADRSRNVQLLNDRSWFDMPFQYKTQRRAILAIEKGQSGADVFASAFSTWGQPVNPVESKPPPAPPASTQTFRSPVVFPKDVSPSYSSEEPGQARMLTCRDQYAANKATGSNGGMLWIQDNGGYYAECNKRLKG